MVAIIERIIDIITQVMQHFGPITGFLIIILESIIPILPLATFIALNIIVFGPTAGFVISWVATIFGSLLSFFAFRKGFSSKLYRKTKVDSNVRRFMNYISKFPFPQLVLVIALPFTPAFAVNIAAGLSRISTRKFILATIIGKISIVYFWGWVGYSFIESLSNPYILLKIGGIMGIVYVISFVIQKLLKIKEE